MDTVIATPVAAACGLNATLPVLTLLVLARLQERALGWPLDTLDDTQFFVLLGAIAVLEALSDKIPALDHVMHVVWAPIAATAGAAVLAETAGADAPTAQAAWLGVFGAGTALASHALRAAVRPAVTVTTAGLGNPVVSFLEDVAAVAVTVAAVLAPVLAVAALVGWLVLGIWALRAARGLARRRMQPRA